MIRRISLLTAAALLVAVTATGTTFVYREDAEMIASSDAIVHGIIVAARVDESGDFIQTVYDLRVLRALKGDVTPGQTIQVSSPGGIGTKRFTYVASAAHFAIDQEVVVMLLRHKGAWAPGSMTLSKFTFAVSKTGRGLLVRDEEVAAPDGNAREHTGKVRDEAKFLDYIHEVVQNRRPERPDYFVDEEVEHRSPWNAAADAIMEPVPNAAFPAETYSIRFYSLNSSCVVVGQFGGRFTTAVMNAGINFKKSTAQDAAGVGDGGVGLITNAAAAWTNHAGSAVNVTYGGTTATAILNTGDGTNMVLWNDPNNNIPGTFPGTTSTVATAFMGGGVTHSFDGSTFVSISGSDIIVNDGYSSASQSAPTVMTHEMGHSLGLRHSNQSYLQNVTPGGTGPDGCTLTTSAIACSGSMECANTADTAIMFSSASNTLNGVLQTWDGNAIGALYPAAGTPPAAPTNVTIFAVTGTSVSLSWSASDGATSYKVYRRTGPGSYSFLADVPVGTSYVDTSAISGTAYQYVVHALNGSGESGDSNSDFATAMAFTDTMGSGLTIKLLHFTELRTAVNALRTLAGLSSFSFALPTPAASVTMRKTHLDGLRTALNEARTALGGSSVTFAETLVAGSTTMKPSHMTELRNGVF